MCSAGNFKSHIKRGVSLANPFENPNPLKAKKANLGNDLDLFSGNAEAREGWDRQRAAQSQRQANIGSYSNTYTDASGKRQTVLGAQRIPQGSGSPQLNRLVQGFMDVSKKQKKTLLGGGS